MDPNYYPGIWPIPFGYSGRDRFFDLPEDVRAGIERHRNRIRSEEDMARLIREYEMRR